MEYNRMPMDLQRQMTQILGCANYILKQDLGQMNLKKLTYIKIEKRKIGM